MIGWLKQKLNVFSNETPTLLKQPDDIKRSVRTSDTVPKSLLLLLIWLSHLLQKVTPYGVLEYSKILLISPIREFDSSSKNAIITTSNISDTIYKGVTEETNYSKH